MKSFDFESILFHKKSKQNKMKQNWTFDCQLFSLPLLLVSAESSDVSDADDVVVDVESQRVKLEELDPQLCGAAAVPNLHRRQVLGGTWNEKFG